MRHLIFLFADHFEPRSPEALEAWGRNYPQALGRYGDASGRPPRHTWFYDEDDPSVLDMLGHLCRQGFGEIEMHLHHSFDTAATLWRRLEERKQRWGNQGALITTDGRRTFGLVHGKWSLDNSRGDAHCGVNNELTVLREAGCYADFTFPAWGRMQPARKRSIYYATDDPAAPKSYDDGVPVEVGRAASGDLMIFQGPGRVSGVPRSFARCGNWLPWLMDRFFLTCAVDAHLPPTPSRVDRWVKAQVGVKGRPEWVFVKVHSHGARTENYESYFNRSAAMLHSHLARRYNDGKEWRLHYATARETYNIVKAAEAGRSGDPEEYRDFVIKPYQNTR